MREEWFYNLIRDLISCEVFFLLFVVIQSIPIAIGPQLLVNGIRVTRLY